MKTAIPQFVIVIQIVCLASLQNALAVSPAPDGGYPGGNTAEGQKALLSRTTGSYNTAIGYLSLLTDTTSSFNTAVGAGTLLANIGDQNTATGAAALLSNTTGQYNTANGALTLLNNTTGIFNTAVGQGALASNTTGSYNTASGAGALFSNTGPANTAIGFQALTLNTTGSNNTAIGSEALAHCTGNNNLALGAAAGQQLTTGDYNIDMGNEGFAGEAGTIRIGDSAHQGATYIAGVYGVAVAGLTVVMDSSNRLGTMASSRRFKDDIRPMDKSSEAILALKPVTFHYKKEIDPAHTSQFGLVAEDVEKVNPDLVVRDKEGKAYSVRYDQVNAMLLNEFLKEHRKVEQQRNDFEAAIAQQQGEIEALTTTVKQQAAEIQKVSAQLATANGAARVRSDIDGSSRETDTSGSELVNPSLADLK